MESSQGRPDNGQRGSCAVAGLGFAGGGLLVGFGLDMLSSRSGRGLVDFADALVVVDQRGYRVEAVELAARGLHDFVSALPAIDGY